MNPSSASEYPKRVLITAGVIDGGRSGVGRYIIELVASLRAGHAGVDLHVAGLDADRKFFPAIDDEHWLTIPERCAGGVMSFLWHQLALPGHLRRRKIELLHSPTYRRIVWRSPVPQVATIHDCAPFVLRDKYGFLRGLLGRQIAPALARRCRQVIAVSHHTAKDLCRFMNLPEAKVHTVWNGIDHGQYHARSESEIAEFLKRKGQAHRYFLFVARLEHPGKNHVGLIAAYERFREKQPQASTQLVLGGSDWMGAEVIHQRIAASPYRDDIRVLGFVPDEDLPLWYCGCSAIVMPTFFEGFGLPVIEAYACGAAAGLSDIGALHEVGGDLAEFFDPRDAGAMADCLRCLDEQASVAPAETKRPALARAPAEGAAVPDRGREPALERGGDSLRARLAWSRQFSWKRCAEGVQKIYNKSYD